MKSVFLFAILMVWSATFSWGQEVAANGDSLSKSNGVQVANIEARTVVNWDSLRTLREKLRSDSIQAKLGVKRDSLTKRLKLELDSTTNAFNKGVGRLDSASSVPHVYARKLDSAYSHFQDKMIGPIQRKYDSLGLKTSGHFSKVSQTIKEKRNFLDSLFSATGQKGIGPEFQLNSKLDLKLPDLNAANLEMIGAKDMTSMKFSPLEPAKLPSQRLNNPLGLMKMPEVKGLAVLKDVQKYSSGISTVAGKLNGVKDSNGKVDKEKVVKAAEVAVESRLSKIDGVAEVQSQIKVVEELKKKSDGLKEMDEKKLKESAKKEFVDHLAGKEEKLKKDMASIEKVQMKYRNVDDARFLPKRPPNEMKGKPFVERLVPGVSNQIFRLNNIQVDFSAYVAYKITGKVAMGVSGFQRFEFPEQSNPFVVKKVDVLGFRVFANLKLLNKINSYVELETYRINPLTTSQNTHGYSSDREFIWKNKLNIGLVRPFKISKSITGEMLMLQNIWNIRELLNPKYFSVRFGLQYNVKKKKKGSGQA
jgi:hypothetical protein